MDSRLLKTVRWISFVCFAVKQSRRFLRISLSPHILSNMEAKELDMINRDPNSLNDNLTVKFEDVFGEPEGAHSPECAWKCAHMCYEGARKCCYIVLTVLCSWLCGLCWGCEYACITFHYVYSWTPSIKSYILTCGVQQKFFETCLACCLGPVCSTCGLMLSNIKVTQG